ncbi:MAG: diguanylate cyclase domain-containing protein [Solirubrobacteraceae bacterium]
MLPMLVGALTQPDAFREMLESLEDGVYLVDRRRRILFWNSAAERISGFAASEVVGHRCPDNILRHVDCHGTQLCTGPCPLTRTMRDGLPRSADVWLHHKAGQRVPVALRATPIRDAAGQVIGAMEFFTDRSRVVASEEQISTLRALALSDPLTGLPNRRYFEMELNNRMAEVRRHGHSLGFLFADIDRFKSINDTYGHDVGDMVLKMVASTLSANLRTGDTVARYGGEEFTILLPYISQSAMIWLAGRLRTLIRNCSIDLPAGGEVFVTITIGATQATPEDDPVTLLHRADEQLYRGKRAGRDQVMTDLLAQTG